MSQLTKWGFVESLDFKPLPGQEKLNEAQTKILLEAYNQAYRSALPLVGDKIAIGKAQATAKIVLEELLKAASALQEEEMPRSIFYGLDNCQ
jgi:hypothetical protein